MKEANLTAEYQKLKSDYLKIGETYLKYGTSYPKHEVNYEQSIVAPAVMVLSQLYLETKDMRYLDEAKRQMKLLDSFSGLQPSFHLNDIAIRHWDGYWFGKEKCGEMSFLIIGVHCLLLLIITIIYVQEMRHIA